MDGALEGDLGGVDHTLARVGEAQRGGVLQRGGGEAAGDLPGLVDDRLERVARVAAERVLERIGERDHLAPDRVGEGVRIGRRAGALRGQLRVAIGLRRLAVGGGEALHQVVARLVEDGLVARQAQQVVDRLVQKRNVLVEDLRRPHHVAQALDPRIELGEGGFLQGSAAAVDGVVDQLLRRVDQQRDDLLGVGRVDAQRGVGEVDRGADGDGRRCVVVGGRKVERHRRRARQRRIGESDRGSVAHRHIAQREAGTVRRVQPDAKAGRRGHRDLSVGDGQQRGPQRRVRLEASARQLELHVDAGVVVRDEPYSLGGRQRGVEQHLDLDLAGHRSVEGDVAGEAQLRAAHVLSEADRCRRRQALREAKSERQPIRAEHRGADAAELLLDQREQVLERRVLGETLDGVGRVGRLAQRPLQSVARQRHVLQPVLLHDALDDRR